MTAFARRRPLCGLLCALALLAWSADNPRASLPQSRQTLNRLIPLARGGRLTLDNGLGDVTIQAWTRSELELRADRSADSVAELAELPIDVRALPDAVVIASRAPVYSPDLRVRIDYRLRVPADTDLKLVKTDRGRVVIEGIAGRAVVRVVNGAVRIRGFAGALDVTTTNGEIDAELTRLVKGDAVSFDTYNGDITLRVPRGAPAHYTLRTFNGAIDSNTPMKVLTTYGPSVAHEDNGVEDPIVRITSVNGTIRLSR
jgi:hypothetical protein